jgi:cellulose synthase/poly-beta-1,6-N-acetylglucosamine synthase-like glycosyltransferase
MSVPLPMRPTISVVIPACNAEQHLKQCLLALSGSLGETPEIIVVDDGSRDDTMGVAKSFGTKVMSTGRRKGPAFARNMGAAVATGDVVLFLDADVCVKPETLARIQDDFERDPALDALIGSYDTEPFAPDFVSQYRNLMHCFVHQTGSEQASTFWSGCGAIRREVFLEHSGFSEYYGRPAIEDIELGYRLIRANRKIMLDHDLLVKHLKRWTFWSLLKTDILDRGIPWTELILRDGTMPNDLNLQLSQRVSVALVFVLIALAGTTAVLNGTYLLVPFLFVLFLMLARWWGEVGSYRRPRRALVMLTAMLAVVACMAYWQKMYGLIPFLAVTPIFLLLRHRYDQRGKLQRWHRIVGMAFICLSMVVAAIYLPAHHLMLACFVVLLLLGLLNSQFYLFLAGKRGISFMLAAIPFHLLYHFYSGVSFIIGFVNHTWANALDKTEAAVIAKPVEIKQPVPTEKLATEKLT